jgi:hypothetical protein
VAPLSSGGAWKGAREKLEKEIKFNFVRNYSQIFDEFI